MSDIDWSVELRKIEREYDGLPPLRSRTQIRLQKIQEIITRQRWEERLTVVGIWTRLALISVLVTALYWWPYGRACGFSLGAFLAAQAVVVIGGVSLAITTWRVRALWPFIGAAVCVIAAWTVIALQTLPRLGYDAPTLQHVGWSCTTQR